MTLHIILLISVIFGFVGSMRLAKHAVELDWELEHTNKHVDMTDYFLSFWFSAFGCSIFLPSIIVAGYLVFLDLIG